KFRGESSFTTWLYRMVVNTCMDAKKAAKRRTGVALDLDRIPGWQSQEEDAARAETTERVQRALSSLPPKLRMPVLLRYFEDFSYEEMAQALNCSLGTVASRLHKGHKLLAEKLAKYA